jgi:hypothetical protein
VRIGPIPENPLERFLLATGHVPVALADTMLALLLARTVRASALSALRCLFDERLSRAARAVTALA